MALSTWRRLRRPTAALTLGRELPGRWRVIDCRATTIENFQPPNPRRRVHRGRRVHRDRRVRHDRRLHRGRRIHRDRRAHRGRCAHRGRRVHRDRRVHRGRSAHRGRRRIRSRRRNQPRDREIRPGLVSAHYQPAAGKSPMCRRRRGTFRVAGIGIFASLLLAGCSSGSNAPLKDSNERRGDPAPKASPDFENLSQRKSANISAGGLEAPETGSSLGDNLLVNGDFARGLEGWHASARCFRPDSATRAPNGKPSLKIENPDSCGPFAKVAVNKFVAPPGVYSIGGEIKTPDLAEPRRLVVGAGMDLFTACETEVVNGTADWQQLVGKHCIVAPGTHAPFQLAINGETSGSAWFANMYVRREIAPLVRIFMLYPNYRGYLFADQPQQVRAAVTLNPGPDLRREDLV